MLKENMCYNIMSNTHDLQVGGACSLCGAPGTNKTTCPRNPKAKKPNVSKHSAGGPSAAKKLAAKEVIMRLKQEIWEEAVFARLDEGKKPLTNAEIKQFISQANLPALVDQFLGEIVDDFQLEEAHLQYGDLYRELLWSGGVRLPDYSGEPNISSAARKAGYKRVSPYQ